jgi:hypothetical protein
MPVLVAELAKRVCQNSHRIAILARIILARGLRPGERRGGRKKGTPNRRTSILRDLAIDGNRRSRCSGSSATRLAKCQSPQLQAIAVQQTPETELARKSDAELFENLRARAAALGFTIERIRPQLTLVDGSKQDERA